MPTRPPQPPRAKRQAHAATVHGDTRQDPYHWLREKAHPNVRAYLRAENTYTERIMRSTKPLQKRLFQEMKARMQETDSTYPQPYGDYLYYTRTVKGKQYPIECRKHKGAKGREQVILDVNALARGKAFCSVGSWELSEDQRYLAYTVNFTGDELYAVYIKDLQTGKIVDDQVKQAYEDVAWARDGRTLFYTVLDAAHRPYRVYRHVMGTAVDQDVLVFEETDERFSVMVRASKSLAYIFIRSQSGVTSEYHIIDAARPLEAPWCFQLRKQNVEYQVTHQGDMFYVLTNERAKNFRLLRTPVATPSAKHWKEVIAHSSRVMLDSMEAFAEHLVIYERRDGVRGISILDAKGKRHVLALPEQVRDVDSLYALEYRSTVMRFRYSSFVTPVSVYEYDMQKRTLHLRKRQTVRGHRPQDYQMERVFVRAKDGTRVPMSLVYRRSVKRDGANPCLLYGYGSYGVCIDPGFSSHRLSLLDRGVIFAIGHVRGGSDLGFTWYERGKYQYKQNSFHDFIACAEYLIKQNYTSSARLAIKGGSAGGLLVGAVMNMRPDLFQSVIADVPFVDALNTMLDPSLPLTIREYEEWGNPLKLAFYRAIKAYSPYDNVEAKAYPHLLVTAGLNDSRVSYWEPAKWVAKLRALKQDDHLLLLKTEMTAGHAGPSGRYAYLEDMAFQYAFLFDRWGIKR